MSDGPEKLVLAPGWLDANIAAAKVTEYERGRAAGLAEAVEVLTAYREYDKPMCCDGRECGCQGASVFDTIEHYIRALSPSPDHVLVPREPTEAMLEAALDATGERILPFAAERECGVPVECDISEEDASAINKGTKAAERDDVLLAFHNECDKPTSDDIANWVSRYPQFEVDIRAHAAIRNEWSQLEETDFEVDDITLARGRSRALNLLHQVQQKERQQAASGEEASATETRLPETPLNGD